MADRKWIHKLRKGGLHRSLGIPLGQKIPAARIRAALKAKSLKVRRQARAAITLAKLRKRRHRKSAA